MRPVKEWSETAANRLKNIRIQANLTQEQFAGRIGVATNSISRIETGKINLTANIALKIKEEFFVSLDYLFGFTTYEEGEPPCSATCEELINAQNMIDMQDTMIKELEEKLRAVQEVSKVRHKKSQNLRLSRRLE